IPQDEFTKSKERLEAKLSGQAKNLKSIKLQLIYRRLGSEKTHSLNLEPSPDDPLRYDIPTDKIPNGEYELSVKLTGKANKERQVTGNSESITYVVKDGLPETDEIEEPADESNFVHILGILGILLSIGAYAGIYLKIKS